MNKSGQYVGVDEKYIPEEEKYVDNTLNDEIKGTLRDGVRSIKNYVSKDENKEKIKNTGKKVLKVGKGIAIGYLTIWIFVILIALTIIIVTAILAFKGTNDMNKASDEFDKYYNKIEEHIDDKIDYGFQE